MSLGQMIGDSNVADRVTGASPRLKAQVAGVFYCITIVTSLFNYFVAHGNHLGHAADLTAAAAYIVVAALLYELLAPVSKPVSLLAAFFSLEGIAHGDDGLFFFGFYCLLLGYLIFRSTFLPRVIGVLMALAGLGLLANASAIKVLLPAGLAHAISPYAFGVDGLGELSLALWLLVFGVNAAKWEAANRPAR